MKIGAIKFRKKPLPIGVDLGADSVKMLQLEPVANHLMVVASGRMAIPEEARVNPLARFDASLDCVRQLLRTQSFCGDEIVITVPRDVLHVKNVRLPLIPASELAAAVNFEARHIFPFDVDHAQLHFLAAGEVRQGTEIRQEVIALAAEQAALDGFIERVHGCGAKVAALDIEPAALHRTYERYIRRREDETDVFVLVDIGQRYTQVIVCRGRDLSFFKSIEIGGDHFNTAVSKKLGISVPEARALRRRLCTPGANADRHNAVNRSVFDATRPLMESLSRELAMCLRYYLVTFRGHRPRVVRLTGGEANDPQLLAISQAGSTIPIEVAQPMLSVDTGAMRATERTGTLSEWTLAMGLALKTTKLTFGAIDGKPRETLAVRGEKPSEAMMQVVDVNVAVHAAGAGPIPAEPRRRASDAPPAVAPPEVANA